MDHHGFQQLVVLVVVLMVSPLKKRELTLVLQLVSLQSTLLDLELLQLVLVKMQLLQSPHQVGVEEVSLLLDSEHILHLLELNHK